MDQKIGIQGIGVVTASDGTEESLFSAKHCLQNVSFSDEETAVAAIPEIQEQELEKLILEQRKYKTLDRSVLLSMLASRKAIKQAAWDHGNVGVNIGSSRGATRLFEANHENFLNGGQVQTLSSPTTSLGNLASWVANDLRLTGITFSHSITCSTAMHALLNGIAWLNAGMQELFLVGGTEAPLTDFTIAQMKALRIYSSNHNEYPCRALDLKKQSNTFVLGEGAGSICIKRGLDEHSLAWILSWGFSQEPIEHHTSLSENAACFYNSMQMATKDIPLSEIDVIIQHAPGTLKGDSAEQKAITNLFSSKQPLLSSNKWKIGHTLGASGILSIDLAINMLKHNRFIGVPYLNQIVNNKPINNILVNAAGFGGNAVSILISRNNIRTS
jgi:3-oxoacyl-[acyl-carrier-protein] synthase II